MDRKFCGKCGKPLAECTCENKLAMDNENRFGATGTGTQPGTADTGRKGGKWYTEHFNNIALAQGEIVVRQYHIGVMPDTSFIWLLLSPILFLICKLTSKASVKRKGGAYVVITNKRVISKSDSSFLGMNTTSVEEIALENVVGVKNYYSLGYYILKIHLLIVFVGCVLVSFNRVFAKGLFISERIGLLAIVVICFLLAFLLARSIRKPSYLFSVYASSTGQALVQGSNMLGKMIDRYSTGIVFRYRPTTEAVKMMCEMGACIMDLKNKGDYAIDAWKQV